MNLFFLAKKMLGLASHYDNMMAMNSSWTAGSASSGFVAQIVTTITTITTKITAFVLPGSAGIAGTAGTMAAGTVAIAKYTVITTLLVTAATVTINTAEIIDQRTSQARAVIADTLAHPMNIDLALNPAYHGNREQLNQSEQLTAAYWTDQLGANYSVTPFVGFGDHSKATALYKKYLEKKAASRSRGDDSGGLGVPTGLVQTDALVTFDIDEDSVQQLLEFEEREAFQNVIFRAARENFTTQVSSSSNGGATAIEQIALRLEAATAARSSTSTTGIHGVEVRQEHTRVLQTLHDGTVIYETYYTTVIKQEAFTIAASNYLDALRGGSTIGPKLYINSISPRQGQRMLNRLRR